MLFYREEVKEVFSELKSNEKGLSQAEANSRIETQGYNELQVEQKINKWKLFVAQFKSFIIYILLFAVVLSFITGYQEYKHEVGLGIAGNITFYFIDAIIILIILLANAAIGFFQELGAQKSLDALKKLSIVKAKVFRDENLIETDSKFLVKGDVIYLEAGDKVPADCRLIEVTKFRAGEAALTGESLPVEKIVSIVDHECQIGDQKNMIFSSTPVLEGTAKAIVVKTAMDTEIGKITTSIRDTEEEMTPLQKKLDVFGKKLGYVIIAICLIVLGLELFTEVSNGNPLTVTLFLAIFMVAVALAVAAVPEGLPAVVTVTLSIGVKKLLKKNALVRKLSSVETLGSCDVICTDKTGTLTKNEMTVERVYTYDTGVAELEGVGYTPQGTISKDVHTLLFEIGELCNNASLYKKEGMWQISGDPTEAALLVSAQKAKVDVEKYSRLDEEPFDSSRKMMSVLVENDKKLSVFVKGGPDKVLDQCTHVMSAGKKIALTQKMRDDLLVQNDAFASDALRVLAFAYKDVSSKKDFTENDLIFVGFQAMMDPPREDVPDAIVKTKAAGIRVIMITGDYKKTAEAIGKNIGITGEILTGDELSKMSDDDLGAALRAGTNIFARVIPEHKQRIVAELQKEGHIVAMTGDGVNDAPALKKANIGVAVGSGTDVAKEASDFVLLDDSFANIVGAIEEGRGIYDNIQKTIMLLLSGNLSEVLIIFLAVLLGWNLPLTAIMLLWINLITDGAPALALAVDPYSKGIMTQKPKNANEGILPKKNLALISIRGIVSTLIALVIFYVFGGAGEDPLLGQTMVFLYMVLSETLLVILIRDYYGVPLFSNRWVWIAVAISMGLQLILMLTPMRVIFDVVLLSLSQFGVVVAGAAVLVVISFLTKWFIIKPES
jgi:Ca2+-transporting ATPase